MREKLENRRADLLEGLLEFIRKARSVPGVRQISLVGSITTPKPNPKDIDVLVVVSDEADLAPLARHARRLQGHAQSLDRGADVFLANERGEYIGRTCRWKECRPGIRQSVMPAIVVGDHTFMTISTPSRSPRTQSLCRPSRSGRLCDDTSSCHEISTRWLRRWSTPSNMPLHQAAAGAIARGRW
jgi:hypothetical protein